MNRFLPLMCLVALIAAAPALAQWSQIPAIPATNVFSVSVNGDTIVAGVDSAAYISTNAGATWKLTARVAAKVISVQAAFVHDGRLYVGTYGQGVFFSDDLGDTWTAYNQGLVGGIADSQLFTSNMIVDSGRLILSTLGAGVWARDLSGGGWVHFGEVFEPNQSSDLNDVATGNGRLVAVGGANGSTFFRDPGDADWTMSWLDNIGITAGLTPLSAFWTGQNWVVGTNVGVFTSAAGHEPWTFAGPNIGVVFNLVFAQHSGDLFAAFSVPNATLIGLSTDHGATWQPLDDLPLVFVYRLTVQGDELYAARADGLWRRQAGTTAVAETPASPRLRLSIAGPQPVRGDLRFRIEAPRTGNFTLEVFDASGRRVGETERGLLAAGDREIEWSAGGLAPGVYLARTTVGLDQATARFIRLR